MFNSRYLVVVLLLTISLSTISNAGTDENIFTSISVGKSYACGLILSGKAYCWGWNENGQLGNKSTTNSNIPIAMAVPKSESLLSFSNLSTGVRHACGITLSRKAYCWGWNKYGQLGNKSVIDSTIPIAVADSVSEGDLTFLSISAGDYHTYGIVSSGKIYCWGRNEDGQLGNGRLINSSIPVLVVAPQHESDLSFSSIAVSGNHSCALSTGGKAYCWGYNGKGQLGNKSNKASTVPVAVADPINSNTLVFSKISTGYSSTCALTVQGQAYCWGINENGELGNNAKADSTVPVAVAASKSGEILTFLVIDSGNSHTCGLSSNGITYCWGQNYFSELGYYDYPDSNIPVEVIDPSVANPIKFSSVSAGDESTCALTASGKAYCWGYNRYGGLGNNDTLDSSVPVAVIAPNTVVVFDSFAPPVESELKFSSISAGSGHTCALTSSGKAYCWGYNDSGQLGNGKDGFTNSSIPVPVSAPKDGKLLTFLNISASEDYTCGVATNGKAYCWGRDFTNPDFEKTTNSNIPVAVQDSKNGEALVFSSLSSGFAHTCGLVRGGRAYCWGENIFGSFGNNSTKDSSNPVAVAAPKGGSILESLRDTFP